MENKQLNFSEERKNNKNFIDEITKNRNNIYIILDGLTNFANIGMIFRIADALRVKKIFFYNYKNKIAPAKINKFSRSTIKYIELEYINTLSDIIKLKENSQFIALDKTTKSIDYKDFTPIKAIYLIIGSEKFGISQELLNLADESIHLPMYGINTSINVATATAVAAFEIVSKLQNI